MSAPATLSGRQRQVQRVLLVTLFLNLAVAAAKLLVGMLTDTLSMVADGYHSALDGSSNVVGLIAIQFAYKPADADHQYGHRKYETVSAMAISLALFAAAWRIATEAWQRIAGDEVPRVGAVNFAVMLATIAVNFGVSRYEERQGRRLNSQFLISDAAHTRSDVYASGAVIASLVASRLGFAWVDVAASLAIAAIILSIGYRIVRDGLGVIADQIAIEPDVVAPILRSIPGVRGFDRVRSRGTGDHVFMDLVCYVDGSLTLRAAHDLADAIESRIQAELPQVKDIVVHLEPAPGPSG